MIFRCVVVAAVSTRGQAADDKASIPVQLSECRGFCAGRGWPVVAEVVIPGHSRDYNWLHEIIRDCPEYGELVHLVETDEVSLVVCRHYDRLWRTDPLRAQFVALCREHRCQVYSVSQPQEPVDPSRLARRRGLRAIVETLSGALSEEEQEIRVARHRAGMERRIAAGKHHPGPTTPYGYRRSEKGLVADADERHWVEWIYLQRAQGWCASTIARRLMGLGVPVPSATRPSARGHAGPNPIWCESVVWRILRNGVYRGLVRWGEIEGQGEHEAIVMQDLWDRVRAADALGRRERAPAGPGRWLHGLLRCGHCGHAMVYVSHRAMLRCGFYLRTGGLRCRSNGVGVAELHEFVLLRLAEALDRPEVWVAARAARRDDEGLRLELEQVEAAIAGNVARYRQWSGAYEQGVIALAELVQHRARLGQEAGDLRRRRDGLAAGLADQVDEGEIGELAGLALRLRDAPDEVKSRVAMAMIERVVLRQGEEPDIIWR